MSEIKSRVNVHSKLTVVSDTPVQPGKSYPLSVLDHAMGLHTLHIVFYYRYEREDKAGSSSDLGRLRKSLADVLSYYPPVTGRLSKGDDGNWVVRCNDAGVRVLKAKVNTTLDEWLSSADGSEERDLTAWDEMPQEDLNIWSPFRIQLSDFEGGGLAIGLSCPHMHADPNCATLLIKSWTDIYRGQCISHSPFFHPPGLRGRTTNNPNTNTKSANLYASKSKSPITSSSLISSKMSTATFRFSDSTIKKSLSVIQTTSCPNASPFDFLTALFWLSVIHAKPNIENKEPSKISIGIDFRKLLEAPLPHGFFGNALHFSTVTSDEEEEEINKQGTGGYLEYLTRIIHENRTSLNEEEFWSGIDWFESQKDEGGKFTTPFRMYGPELTSVNLEHMLAYAAVLEGKKPLHVSYHIGNFEGEGLILVLPSPEEGFGRTVMITLPDEQMAKICRDLDILRLEPTMLVSGL